MVGDEHLHPATLQDPHLVAACDTAVDGHQHIGGFPHHALYRRFGDAVAFVRPAGDEWDGIGAEHAQPAGHHRSRRDAVQIEIAEHDDAPSGPYGAFQAFDHPVHSGDVIRIAPIAVEGRVQEFTGGLGSAYPACHQSGCDEPGQAETGLQCRNGLIVGRQDVKACRHVVTYSIVRFLAAYFLTNPSCRRNADAQPGSPVPKTHLGGCVYVIFLFI